MVIVDSHCHVSPIWYEPVEVLLFQMERNGVERAVLIQQQGQTDNAYLLECARRFPGRFAPVVLVDPSRADAPDVLEELARQGASGVRLGAATRSPGTDPLAIWRTAGRLDLTVSCAGTSAEFASDEFEALVRMLPEVRIVLEHLAATSQPDTDESGAEQRRSAFGLARYPNLSMKFHGLGEFSRRANPASDPFPFERPIPPWLDLAYDAFGPARLMWGSDFPPVSRREGYRNALHLPWDQLGAKPPADIALMFGGCALSLFPIRG